MNGCKGVILICLVVAVFPLAGWAQEPAALPEPVEQAEIASSLPEPVEQAEIAPSLLEPEAESAPGPWMIGTRITRFELQDDSRGTRFNNSFMGSVTEIKDEQDDMPNKLFVQYQMVGSPFWIGVSYDHLKAETWDGSGSDGSVEIDGFIPYVQARWENETRAVPYAELGLAFYQTGFNESEGWSDGGRRTVDLDGNVMGMEIAGGVSINVYKGLSVDLYVRYMDVEDITGSYSIDGRREGDVIFTMSHTAYGLGLEYRF